MSGPTFPLVPNVALPVVSHENIEPIALPGATVVTGTKLVEQIEALKKAHFSPTVTKIGQVICFKATWQRVNQNALVSFFRKVLCLGPKQTLGYLETKENVKLVEKQVRELKLNLPDEMKKHFDPKFSKLGETLKQIGEAPGDLSETQRDLLRDNLSEYQQLLMEVNNAFSDLYAKEISQLEKDLKNKVDELESMASNHAIALRAKDGEIDQQVIEIETKRKEIEQLEGSLAEKINLLDRKDNELKTVLKTKNERIDSQNGEIEKLRSDLQVKKDEVADREKYINQLRQDKEEIFRLARVELDAVKAEHADQMNAAIKTKNDQVGRRDKEIAQLHSDLQIKSEQSAEKDQYIDKLREDKAEIFRAAQVQVNLAKAVIEDLKKEIQEYDEAKAHFEQQIARLHEEIKELREKNVALEQRVQKKEHELKHAKTHIESLRLSEKEKEIEIERLKAQLEGTKKALEESRKAHEKTKADLAESKEDNKQLLEQINRLTNLIAEIREDKAILANEIKEHRERTEALEKELKKTQVEMAQELNTFRSHIEKVEAELRQKTEVIATQAVKIERDDDDFRMIGKSAAAVPPPAGAQKDVQGSWFGWPYSKK